MNPLLNEHGETTTDATLPQTGEGEAEEILDHPDAPDTDPEKEREETELAQSIHRGLPLPTPTESLLPKVR